MIVKIENVEIRGHEVKKSKKDDSEYIIVRFEDETGKPHEIIDRDMENQPHYKRGTPGHMWADLITGKTKDGSYARLELKRFQIVKKEKEAEDT